MTVSHQTHTNGCRYVRLTFRPHGGRKRTVWAIELRPGALYKAVSVHGETEKRTGTEDGVPVYREELIVVTPDEVEIRPAGMSLTYARLEMMP